MYISSFIALCCIILYYCFTVTSTEGLHLLFFILLVLTNLTIVNFTTGDSGDYSCQSYYNPKKLMSSKTVVSKRVVITINEGVFCYMQKQANIIMYYFDLGGKALLKIDVEVGIAFAAIVAIIIIEVAIFSIGNYHRQWLHHRDEESKDSETSCCMSHHKATYLRGYKISKMVQF